MLLSSSAALGCRLADPARDEAFVFHSFERLVNRAERDLALRPRADVVGDRHAVRILAEAGERQQHQLFELPEDDFRHAYMLDDVAVIEFPSSPRPRRSSKGRGIKIFVVMSFV